jgi:hypothetical protein
MGVSVPSCFGNAPRCGSTKKNGKNERIRSIHMRIMVAKGEEGGEVTEAKGGTRRVGENVAATDQLHE